jgi:hypothetical protein
LIKILKFGFCLIVMSKSALGSNWNLHVLDGKKELEIEDRIM